ncbi:aldehyde dehydrogenase [Acetobacterium sp. KB-1]|jgi:propionaldehyde dehydrogenase|uniref:aldehyde dehydrogenase n=1 Tax=Acetobacterium sp. KB-1 TaxID=2184575 RepID=UPI000DBEB142|nr:aldehyde dehydrogenase [Acetobacterium sp. KB-1]AWW25875.1 ethanolamine utilization protein EutE [Acetobacterium sp. KB-1]
MTKQLGVFENAKEAIEAARIAQLELMKNHTIDDREAYIANIKKVFMMHIEELAQHELDETGYGRYEDKIIKDTGAIMLAGGTETLPNRIYSTNQGLTVEFPAPFGVIGGVTPVTNPVATVAGNGIAIVASGNSIVFNAHPSAKACTANAVNLINEAITEVGGPCNLITMIKDPSMESLNDIMASPVIKVLVGTGGPAMVATLMKSGKKVIAAGAGNPPSIIDETADVAKAAVGIFGSASFDNGLLCVAEKELFVLDSVYDKFMAEILKQGAKLLTRAEADMVTAVAISQLPNGEYAANKKMVGQHASKILKEAGVAVDGDPKICVFEAQNDDLFVQTEQMMPILPVVRCESFEQAKEWAVAAEHENKHSATIWSKNIDNVTAFGKMIDTTIFVQNGGTLAAFGVGGSGSNGPTIATPTGEGICDAGTFTRRRRFAMADGGNYIL